MLSQHTTCTWKWFMISFLHSVPSFLPMLMMFFEKVQELFVRNFSWHKLSEETSFSQTSKSPSLKISMKAIWLIQRLILEVMWRLFKQASIDLISYRLLRLIKLLIKNSSSKLMRSLTLESQLIWNWAKKMWQIEKKSNSKSLTNFLILQTRKETLSKLIL